MTYNFTNNEKLAALHLVDECLSNMFGTRPMDLEVDPYTWTDVEVLQSAGWTKHEAAGTYGALSAKKAVYIEKDRDLDEDRWEDCIYHELYEWAEEHWDEFIANGRPCK
tara:strand:- start:49 stop:375 length:327 start_codon:yes stop_codon:yes gene_type:complete